MAATARVLVDEGYDRASTNRIAEVAGVSVGSLYQYFPNKQSLVGALVESHTARMIEALDGASPSGAASLDALLGGYVDAVFAAYAVAPSLHRALVQQAEALGVETGRAFEVRAEAMLRDLLAGQPKVARALDAPPSARVAVLVVRAVADRLLADRASSDERAAFRDELVRLLLAYVRS